MTLLAGPAPCKHAGHEGHRCVFIDINYNNNNNNDVWFSVIVYFTDSIHDWFYMICLSHRFTLFI